jgi:hypothetical protein
MGDDLHDAEVANFVTVAEGAVDDVTAPVVCESVDVGKLVDQPSCNAAASPAAEPPITATSQCRSTVRV